MTVKQLTQIERYVGPSTATKPLDCSVGSTFLEEDTSRLFVFDGTGWFPKTQDIVIYDAEGNPLEIEGGRMKVSVDASVVAPEEVVWSNITLRDGSDPNNKLAILPDGSLKVQQSGSEEFAQDVTVQGVKSELEAVKSELVLVKSGIEDLKENQTSGDQKVTLSGNIVADKARYFDYEIMPYRIVGFSGFTYYGVDDSNNLRKSVDAGKTWGATLTTFPATATVGVRTSGALIVWLSNGDVIRTTDDTTFTTVLTGVNPPLMPGVSVHTNENAKIMFCEYSNTSQDLHVYYSADAGATWTSVLTKNRPTDIGHFHSVDFIPGLVGSDEWIVTSGDTGAQVRWWRSINNGTTWEEIFSGSAGTDAQLFRTLGVRKTTGGAYIWVTDTMDYAYICAGKRGQLTYDQVVKVQSLGSPGWGLAGGYSWLTAVTKNERGTNNGEYTSSIMVSGDAGGSWYKELELTGTSSDNGIIGVQGPDMFGTFFVGVENGYGEQGNKTIKMTPRRGVSYPALPILPAKLQHYKKTVFATTTPTVSTQWSDGLEENIYNPILVIKNTTDKHVAVGLSLGVGGYLVPASTTLPASGDAVVYSTFAGKSSIAKLDTIPKGTILGLMSSEAVNSGSVTIEIIGEVYRHTDPRAL